jgi:hypothetical protein
MRRLIALLIALAGCHVSAEVETVRRTFAPQVFPGALNGAPMHYAYEENLHLGTSLPKVITGLELRRVVLRPVAGVSALDFISSLRLAAKGAGALPELPLARFDTRPSLGSAGEIQLEALPNELAPYVQKDVPFEVTIDAAPPAQDWSVEVTVEFRAESDGKIEL